MNRGPSDPEADNMPMCPCASLNLVQLLKSLDIPGLYYGFLWMGPAALLIELPLRQFLLGSITLIF